jgi:hypothetical protein
MRSEPATNRFRHTDQYLEATLKLRQERFLRGVKGFSGLILLSKSATVVSPLQSLSARGRRFPSNTVRGACVLPTAAIASAAARDVHRRLAPLLLYQVLHLLSAATNPNIARALTRELRQHVMDTVSDLASRLEASENVRLYDSDVRPPGTTNTGGAAA